MAKIIAATLDRAGTGALVDARRGREIKYHMTKGAGLVYSWTATGTLTFEFHGEPNLKPAGEGIEGSPITGPQRWPVSARRSLE